jgi:hypothetical protein
VWCALDVWDRVGMLVRGANVRNVRQDEFVSASGVLTRWQFFEPVGCSIGALLLPSPGFPEMPPPGLMR